MRLLRPLPEKLLREQMSCSLPSWETERFRVQLRSLEPKTNRSGLRGSLEVGNQILAALSEMEQRHFGGDA